MVYTNANRLTIAVCALTCLAFLDGTSTLTTAAARTHGTDTPFPAAARIGTRSQGAQWKATIAGYVVILEIATRDGVITQEQVSTAGNTEWSFATARTILRAAFSNQPTVIRDFASATERTAVGHGDPDRYFIGRRYGYTIDSTRVRVMSRADFSSMFAPGD